MGHIGYRFKSDGLVPIEEFENHANEVQVAEGDEVEVILDALDDGLVKLGSLEKKQENKKPGIVLKNHIQKELMLKVKL